MNINQQHKAMAEERAACGNWPAPKTEADYLMWIEDEIEVQKDQADAQPNEAPERLAYASELSQASLDLRSAGVLPSPPPWDN